MSREIASRHRDYLHIKNGQIAFKHLDLSFAIKETQDIEGLVECVKECVTLIEILRDSPLLIATLFEVANNAGFRLIYRKD